MQYRAAYLVTLRCALMCMTVIGSDAVLYHTAVNDDTLIYLVSHAVPYLLYPLLGWLADVYFIRYRFVQFSFITMIVTTISATMCVYTLAQY